VTGEFEKQIKHMTLDYEAAEKLMGIIRTAGEEFPCVSCPSKDECGSFKWFVKWFGKLSVESS
jgi:hypothetical protein